ncbi:MAG: hypothetical protein AABW54_00825, partial [Candidatus Micrarchaeota archaeon]
MTAKETMFHAYDVRGVYGTEVTEGKFEKLGRAMAAMADRIIFGSDYRKHNDSLKEAFLAGYSGEVLDVGDCPTPAVSFHSREWGACLTASHNPAGYNGLKPIRERHVAFSRELEQLEQEYYCVVAEGNNPAGGNHITVNEANVTPAPELLAEYLDALPAFEGGVFDLGGGAACSVKQIFPETIFCQPDPEFTCRDPLPEDASLTKLKEITSRRSVLGFAFDGDADRVMAVDEGTMIDGGIATCLIARQLLERGDKIVVNIDFMQETKQRLADEGYRVVVCPVGTKYCVEALEREGAKLAA